MNFLQFIYLLSLLSLTVILSSPPNLRSTYSPSRSLDDNATHHNRSTKPPRPEESNSTTDDNNRPPTPPDPNDKNDVNEPPVPPDPNDNDDVNEPPVPPDPNDDNDAKRPPTPPDPKDVNDVNEPPTPEDSNDVNEPTPQDPKDANDVNESPTPENSNDANDFNEPQTPQDPKDANDVNESSTPSIPTPQDPNDVNDVNEPQTPQDPKDANDVNEPQDPVDTNDVNEPQSLPDLKKSNDVNELSMRSDSIDNDDINRPQSPPDPNNNNNTNRPPRPDPNDTNDTNRPDPNDDHDSNGNKGPVSPSSLLGISPPTPGISDFTIAQAIDDYTQICTYSFNGLAFITGNACADTFFPPGKVSDFFGFQSMRDNAPDGMGHCNLFLDNSANNVLTILSDEQRAKLVALAIVETEMNIEYALTRFPLMQAFRRNLDKDFPEDASGLSESSVQNFSAYLYEIDANITIARAKLYAEIIASLNTTQQEYLDNMISGGFYSWATLPKVDFKGLPSNAPVLVTSYAGDILAWYGGNIDNFTYFCPERQADYFGAFYVKDVPGTLNHSYVIPTYITGDGGLEFLFLLNTVQRQMLVGLADIQKTTMTSLVDHRRQISNELLKLRSGLSINETLIRQLDREYGALDGTLSYMYANAYAKVAGTLNDTQRAAMMTLRAMDNYPCPDGYGFIYAQNGTYPEVINTDFLFE